MYLFTRLQLFQKNLRGNLNAFEKANGIKINYKIAPRREGDIAECYSNPTKAKEELGFEATKTIEDMCRDAWNYEKNN